MIVNISNLNLKSLISSTYDFDISKPSKHLYGPILILAYKNSNTTTKNFSLQKVVQTVKYIVYIYAGWVKWPIRASDGRESNKISVWIFKCLLKSSREQGTFSLEQDSYTIYWKSHDSPSFLLVESWLSCILKIICLQPISKLNRVETNIILNKTITLSL